MPGVNRVLYNLDQRGETTPEERTTARRNIDAISADEVAVLFDDHYKVKQSPIDMSFAANAVLRRLYQNANGEIGAECNYIYDATQDTSGFMSAADKTKLDGIAYGAEVNVQSDWNVDDDSLDSFIRNKPNLSVFVTHDELGARLDSKQDTLTAGRNITIENNVISATADPQEQADWAQTDSSAVDYIKNKPQNLVQDADYVHTDNNFTTAEKNKLSGIEAGAEANVQADWTQTNSSADDFIKNKPANLVQDPDYVHTDNNFTDGDKSKLGGIESGAEANVQSDWNEADNTQDDYIKNKPDLSVYATKTEVASDLAGKQDVLTAGSNISIVNNVISATAEPQVQADWAQTDSSAVDYIKNKPANLVQDADYHHTDNNFTDSDKNKLDSVENGAEPNVQADWAQTNTAADDYIKNKPDLSVYATKSEVTTGLAGKQDTLTAGSNISIVNNVISASAAPQEQADWAQTDNTQVDFIKNKPDLSVYATKTELTTGLAGKQDTISDLSDIRSGASAGSTAVQPATMDAALAGKQDKLTAGNNISIVNNVISATAEPQRQADWTQTDTSQVDYIKHKPANLVQDASYVHTDNNFTTTEKNKLAGIEAGAEVNVQSDWAQTDTTADDYIKNKPSIPAIPPMKDLVAGTGIIITPSATEVEIATDPNLVKDYVAGSRINIAPGANNTTVISNTMHEATFSNVFYLDTLSNSTNLTLYPGGKWRLNLKQLPIYGFGNQGTENKVFLGIRYLDNSDIPSPYGTYRFGRFYPYWDGEPDQTMSPWKVCWNYDGNDPYNNGNGFNYSLLDPRDTQRLRPQRQEGYEWEVDTGISGAWIKVRSKIWWNNFNNDTPGNALYIHVYGTVCYPYT